MDHRSVVGLVSATVTVALDVVAASTFWVQKETCTRLSMKLCTNDWPATATGAVSFVQSCPTAQMAEPHAAVGVTLALGAPLSPAPVPKAPTLPAAPAYAATVMVPS